MGNLVKPCWSLSRGRAPRFPLGPGPSDNLRPGPIRPGPILPGPIRPGPIRHGPIRPSFFLSGLALPTFFLSGLVLSGLALPIFFLSGLALSGCHHASPGATDGQVPPEDASALPDASPPGDGGDPDAGTPDAAPPFTCEPEQTSSPVLDGVLVLDPADPHPGDTVTVVVRSRVLSRQDAPPLELWETFSGGTREHPTLHRAGGNALYYYAIPAVEPGDHCLLGRVAGAPEIAGRFTVTPRPAPPPRCHGGVFKVTVNHQLTCQEQPEWGNELWIYTLDEQGAPLPGITLRLGWPDSTERPIYNDTEPPAPTGIPATLETDAQGLFHGYNPWPIQLNGYMVFQLSVEGCASDVATELTTGWWETNNDGCRFCDPSFANRNVWGHWSYEVRFQVDPAATESCVVPSDHAGQAGCAVEHIHHHPDFTACSPVP